MKKALALFFSILLVVVCMSPVVLAEPEETDGPVTIRVAKEDLAIDGRQLTVRLESQSGSHSLRGLRGGCVSPTYLAPDKPSLALFASDVFGNQSIYML